MTSRRTTSSLAAPSGAHSQSQSQPEQHRLIVLVPTRVANQGTSRPLSDCEQRKQREERNTSPLAIHIECNPDGSYKPMQCFGDPKQPRRMCACYDQEYDQIKAPSRQLKSCNCLAEHHEKSKSTH
ncbi:hypothetical protein HPB47_002656, partial [Ixodes persulcatus]